MTQITFDGRYLGPEPSGIGRYARELVVGIKKLRPAWSWRLVVRHAGDETDLAPARIDLFDAQPYGPATSFRLARKLGPRPSELFHSPFHVMPRGLRCPTVLTMHDAFNFEQPKLSNWPFPINWVEYGYFLWAVPDSMRRANQILCVSARTVDELVRYVPDCKHKMHVVHHGVSAQFQPAADPSHDRARASALLGFDDPFVLSIGGVSPNKNHPGMMRAFTKAFPSHSKVHWVSVNRFGDPKRLRLLARELGIENRYHPLSMPSDSDVLSLLRTAMFLSFCSLVEGFGLPIIEAMASGCPVLTSDVSCLPEVAGNGALLVDPTLVPQMAASMRKLADEPSLRDDLRGRGLERARAFPLEKAARLTVEVYEAAMAAR
jgi:glycosyltransferase involved in cell wall biosynthesis